jgi:hypothetical protein
MIETDEGLCHALALIASMGLLIISAAMVMTSDRPLHVRCQHN